MSPSVNRIDHILWRFLKWATRRPRQYVWRWWQYGLREPPVDPDQANTSLLSMCGYKLEPSKAMRLASCRPGFRRFRFGVYVSATPVHHKSRHWQMYWCRFINDPFELYLVKCALRPRTTFTWDIPEQPPQRPEPSTSLPHLSLTGASDSLLDRLDPSEMDRLLRS